jgi:hypothetical protein
VQHEHIRLGRGPDINVSGWGYRYLDAQVFTDQPEQTVFEQY